MENDNKNKYNNKMSIYGVISAHGVSKPDEFVVIPPGISILPYSKLYNNLEMEAGNFSKDEHSLIQYEKDRIINFSHNTADIQGTHIYNEGDVIPNLYLYFRVTFGEPIPKYYDTTGIVTKGSILPNVVRIIDENEKEIKNNCLFGHDNSIISNDEIWGKTLTLGEVLKLIVNTGKHGNYFLLTCRGGNIITDAFNRLKCGSHFMGDIKSSKESIFLSINTKLGIIKSLFTGKVCYNQSDINNISREYSFPRDVNNLRKYLFFNGLYRFLDGKITKNYTINVIEFCMLNNIIETKNIELNDIEIIYTNYTNWIITTINNIMVYYAKYKKLLLPDDFYELCDKFLLVIRTDDKYLFNNPQYDSVICYIRLFQLNNDHVKRRIYMDKLKMILQRLLILNLEYSPT